MLSDEQIDDLIGAFPYGQSNLDNDLHLALEELKNARRIVAKFIDDYEHHGGDIKQLKATLAEKAQAALKKIAGGYSIGKFGTDSIDREDMQSIAQAALAPEQPRCAVHTEPEPHRSACAPFSMMAPNPRCTSLHGYIHKRNAECPGLGCVLAEGGV